MPWKVKKEIYLILFGCAAIILGSIVLALNVHNTSTEILATIGVLGGFAIIINALPTNGKGGSNGTEH